MPVTIIPDTGINNIYINSDTGRNLILSGACDTGINVLLSGFSNTAPHNALNGIQGGEIGQYYHLTAAEYDNLVTGDVVRPNETGQFYPTSNPSGYITGIPNIVYTTGNQTINGQKEFNSNVIFDQNIRVSGAITGYSASLGKVSFDVGYTGAPIQEGELQWNSTDGTLDLGMNGGEITMQIGQEMFIKVRNQSGSTITNGSAVYLSGRSGNRPLAHLAKADSEATSRVIGIATQDIASPDDGFITDFGYVRGIKTNYTGTGAWGTTWAEGDLLYVSKTVAGQLTNVEPPAPSHSDIVGSVGIVHSNLGSILVSIDRHKTLEELADINGEPLTEDGQFPSWHNAEGYFDFDKNINDYYPVSNPSGYITGVDLSDYSTVSYVTGVSGQLQSQITILNNSTGDYYQNTNPSGYITGFNSGDYSLISFTNDVSGNLQSQISSLSNNTGNYYLNSNPSGYITGVDLSSYATVSLVTGISGDLQGQITTLAQNTGSYYLNTNPSGYITGFNSGDYSTIDFSTGISGSLQSQISLLDSQTGEYYLNSNPSGYITGIDLSSYATTSFVTGVSGELGARVTSLESATGDYYQNTNPSGYITGIDQQSFKTLLHTGIEETGITFPYSFLSAPRVFVDLELVSDTGYLVGVKNVTSSGYIAVFSDVIAETGLYLQTLANNQ